MKLLGPLNISTDNPLDYFAGAFTTDYMTLWNPSRLPEPYSQNELQPILDLYHTTAAGQVHHRVSWKVDESAPIETVEAMYARLLCYALISYLPDEAIVDIFQDLILRYDQLATVEPSSYPMADSRSSHVLKSILGARILAKQSFILSGGEDLLP